MSLTKYYKLLGLPPGADQTAIRKAYRKLAMRYHPDKNPSASAQAKFIAITEAYEILTGKKKAPQARVSQARRPQQRQNAPGTTTNRPKKNEKSHSERVREAKERQEKQAQREFVENELYFRRLTTGWRWNLMRWSAIFGIILSIGLIAERFLPHHFEEDKVTHYAMVKNVSSGNEHINLVQTKKNESYWISRMRYDLFGRHTDIYVRSSWIFHEPIEIISRGKTMYQPYRVHFTFYSNFILVIFFFLLPTITLLMKNRTILFTIIYQTSFYGVNGLILYFLFRNDQWAHLLTLGYL